MYISMLFGSVSVRVYFHFI